MSFFCGIFALDTAAEIRPEWRNFLRNNLSRSGQGSITEYADRRIYLAKLDLGAFDAPGWQSDQRGVTALSGDSLLEGREPSRNRGTDVERLHALRKPSSDLAAILRGSRGSFCAALYRALDGELVLATDKVGVRPIYWMSDGRCLVFAGALRLIENLPNLPLTVDLRGTMEMACFGFPLADRTQYVQIHSMRGGEVLVCNPAGGGGVRTDPYWRWDRDACSTIEHDLEPALHRLYDTFSRAVQLRLGGRKAAFASLSGGLDSRCVVTQLRSTGIGVHSINVSWRGKADQVLGAMYAKAIGTIHHEVTLPGDETGQAVPALASRMIAELGREMTDMGGNPRQLWGGDGGSVGVGHVYMTPATVQTLRKQGMRAGAHGFLRDNSFALTSRPFRARFAALAGRLPLESVTAELERLDCADPGRALYVFLLENDQRRHVAPFYEILDHLRVEFVEPFYDAEVLSAACRLPLDYCLRHRMYNQWLRHFPPQIMQVPWQYYPGHEECPSPMPSDLSTQWNDNGVLQKRRRRDALGALSAALENRSSLKEVLRPEILAAAYVAMGLRVSDAFWFGQQVDVLARPFIRCDGRFELSDA
jgi:asparagine synthetase B (glutamine-hydrolysing)